MSDLIPKRTLEEFHLAAKAAGLDYLIIGGYAASFWGKPRFTADVDYVINSASISLAEEVLHRLNYQLVFLHPQKSFAHFTSQEDPNRRIDLMLVDSDTWSKLKSSESRCDLGGTERYPIVAPLHLISMKLHAAKQPDRVEFFKDINDVVEIMLTQSISFAELEEAGIIEKHGSEKTTSILKQFLEQRSLEK
jgi:hypothetical protein